MSDQLRVPRSVDLDFRPSDITQHTLQLMGLCSGRYVYYEDLLGLSAPAALAPPLTTISNQPSPSPVNLPRLAWYLVSYPDQRLASYVLSGIRDGFRIGVSGSLSTRSSTRNHPSCQVNPSAVSSYLSSERAAGRVLGPLPQSDSVHVSPIGLVPKGHQGNAWRMIVDLSYPSGRSVNDKISSDLCSLRYPSVDDAVGYILAMGRHTQLVKIDLKDAYRILPIHPEDRRLLGINWEGHTYVDLCLPFGLRLAPKIFTAFADVLSWVLHHCGVRYLIHYLDDFLIFGAPFMGEAHSALRIVMNVLADLRVPVSLPKLEGPSTTVSFLGILIDTARMELRLPHEKLLRLRSLVANWLGRRSGRRSEVESLLGHLSHAAIVVRPGRIFLRQLFSLMAKAAARHYFVHLDAMARADLAWWDCFLQDWHGASFIIPNDSLSLHIHTDASGTFGGGALSSDGRWLQVQWPESWSEVDISIKEMVPIVVAAAMWGRSWHQHRVFFHSDNAAVVAIIQKRSAKQPAMLHLLRCLYFYAAFYQFSYSAHHVPGVTNVAADALSRNNMSLFNSLVPQGRPTEVSREVSNLLIIQQPNWGSQSWISLFRATL